ncbi:AMP-binding protein [Spiribacter vilamensis]|uniref:Long-chain acyl-CoA synthetase n=1 Tax=Spiribacter vilamensis TaxID=531306 RepID=A0A4Q8CXX7_9GAMM|nr:AMP-binding protein [Spiribacter vilamensis]RZU97808.1 long-chain acyl-CoA synthetase [Spiribacter vilamensis]TVO61267.1 AMP-binding protein [Spiribacter vilamensis]
MAADAERLTIPALLRTAPGSAQKAALIAYTAKGPVTLERQRLLAMAEAHAQTLGDAGIGRGDRVLIQAPNGVEWIVIALATLMHGAVLVPVDAQMGREDLAHVIADADPARIYITRALRAALPEPSPTAPVIEIDSLSLTVTDDEPADSAPRDDPDAADIATLFYTSGTTGPPKGVPLTHANLVSNVRALLEERIAGPEDRVLLPLPLHHVYPFSVGLLTVMGTGATLILPRSLVGPRIAEALRAGRATILLGVPRLYEALWSRLEARLGGQQPWRQRLFHASVDTCQRLQARLGWPIGRWLFRPVMKRLAPSLRLAVNGGAALDPTIARRLQGLGWRLASGYGLTETAPILTLNAPGDGRLETAGRPLPGVSLRIVDGEVRARGPNVFTGYRHSVVPNDEIFDAEGWFRTGDGGQIDDDGYLHLSGRLSSTVVLSGGENIDPERIERVLNAQPAIREAGVLARDGRLAAVIVAADTDDSPDARQERVNAALRAARADLPAHHAVGEIRLSVDPLPRTRLGKLRRPHLATLFDSLGEEQPETLQAPIDAEAMAPEDQALLADEAALATWEYLAERFANKRLTPDSRLHQDLGLDSLGWMDLGLGLRDQAGIELDDAAIGRVETVRDLLQEVIQADPAAIAGTGEGPTTLIEQLAAPEALLDESSKQLLTPRGPFRYATARLALGGCRAINRRFAHIEVEGEWPQNGPFLITPRHISAYDPVALTDSLTRRQIEPLFWAGWTGLLFSSALRRGFSHIARILPIDPGAAPQRSLALATATLQRGHSLVWFPEGQRGRDGELQPLRPGIGLLLAAHPVPVVPVWIDGTDSVLPVGQLIPQRGTIRIRIGEPLLPEDYGEDSRVIVDSVSQAMAALGPSTTASDPVGGSQAEGADAGDGAAETQ